MAPVAGRPFLEYLLEWLRAAGLRDLILCVGHKKSQIQNWVGDGSGWRLRVRYSGEKKLLGTAGALQNAQKMIRTKSCVVLNGDSFLGVDLRAMRRFHRRRGALATIAIARVRKSARYGAVEIDRRGKITVFREKISGPSLRHAARARRQWINGGVYMLEREFFSAIPAGEPSSLEKDVFPGLVGQKLFGFRTRSYFMDIGIPRDFRRAQAELPGKFLK